MARRQNIRRSRAMDIDSAGPSYSSPSRGTSNRRTRGRSMTGGPSTRESGSLSNRYV